MYLTHGYGERFLLFVVAISIIIVIIIIVVVIDENWLLFFGLRFLVLGRCPFLVLGRFLGRRSLGRRRRLFARRRRGIYAHFGSL
jgi:hypothetical protein